MRKHFSQVIVIGGLLIAPPLFGIGLPAEQNTGNQPITVDLDELEDNPNKFLGKTVRVDGEIDRVLGPGLFTIDERDWADVEREMPVVVPEPFAAIVKEDTLVRVTGVVERVPIARIEQRMGPLSDRIRAEIESQPAIVASDIIATQSGATLRVRVDQMTQAQPGGTQQKQPTVTDANQLAQAKDTNLVGRRVDLKNVQIGDTTPKGFFIRTAAGERIFVMPAAGAVAIKAGQNADVSGVVLELPEGLKVELKAPAEEIYIFADRVTGR
jgi:hypothetical protein